MKTLLIAFITLILSLSVSTSAVAKKAGLTAVGANLFGRDSAFVVSVDDESCTYQLVACLTASVTTHKKNTLSLQVVTDATVGNLHTWILPEFRNYTAMRCNESFTVPRGKNWSLVWVFETSKGKGRIIDAVEQFASSCPAPQALNRAE
jgi:hypothetical protein